MKGFAKLIEGYHFQIALTITFIVIVFTVPIFYYPSTNSIRYSSLPLKCSFLDIASSVVFFLVEGGKFESLMTFSLAGALLSFLFFKFPGAFLLSLCLALTISSVIMVSLVAYYYLSSDRTSHKQF